MGRLDIPSAELGRLSEAVLKHINSYWTSLADRRAFPATNGAELNALFGRGWPDDGIGAAVLDDFEAIADRGRPSTGRFFGYVVGSGEPVGALGEALAAALNQNVTAWRSAPAAVTIERIGVGWLAEAIGCAGFVGSLSGGGSAANLMGLTMAREAKAPANRTGARPAIVYASEQVHMSIPKAMALLGLGRDNLRLIPVDDAFRMRIDSLRAAIAADRGAGLTPIAIVASAGTVVSGAIDPLREIAAIATAEGLWLHVDGAYGVPAALAIPEAFDGLAEADSLSLDAHKWLYQPIHRHPDVARAAFAYSDDYVRIESRDPDEGFAFFEQSIELSRRFRALKLWLSLQYHGRQAFKDAIAADLRHARQLADLVSAEPALGLMAPVPLSAVSFRHRTVDNQALLGRVNANGRVYLSNASIGGAYCLRACFVNHRTTDEDVAAIVREVLFAAAEL